ncbi:hypothetical protein HJFPF1_08675 [Paramyrothecium foliicola]|nr:hypothetical protein HJFPF1_08675 [Paramyrothecium foliicola]
MSELKQGDIVCQGTGTTEALSAAVKCAVDEALAGAIDAAVERAVSNALGDALRDTIEDALRPLFGAISSIFDDLDKLGEQVGNAHIASMRYRGQLPAAPPPEGRS